LVCFFRRNYTRTATAKKDTWVCYHPAFQLEQLSKLNSIQMENQYGGINKFLQLKKFGVWSFEFEVRETF